MLAAALLLLSSFAQADLRTPLENLFNEVDLLIRNQRVDASDVEHQFRDFRELKVFERIPLKEDLPGLKAELEASARTYGLAFKGVRVIQRSPVPEAVPKAITTNQPFRFSDEQVVETLHLEIRADGPADRARAWQASWHGEILRLIDPEGQTGPNTLRGEAYWFRPIRFPALRPRDPMKLLPRWAQANPKEFARKEPLLWSFVQRFQEKLPQALPLYRVREQFLLNDARLSFYLKKTR